MPANARRGATTGAIAALSIVLGFSMGTGASAETVRHAVHHKHAVVGRLPTLPPGVELHTSTSASVGSENHYYSDTVASSHSDLTDLTHRYGQSTPPLYNSNAAPLFEF